MAVDYGMLARVPTIGSRIMAGQEAGRAAAAQNMLLQQRALEFQQAQEDRRLAAEERRMQQAAAMRQEQIFEQAAQMIRQSGLDPDDPAVLQQFTAAAVQSRNPQLMSLATSMSDRLAKRRQEREEAAAVAGAMRPPTAQGAIPPLETPTTPAVAASAAEAPEAVAPQQLSPLAVEQATYQRPAFYGQGQFAGTAPTAVTSPIGEYPTAPTPPVNQLAPPSAAPANAMLTPPAVQVAGPAAMPTAGKPDVARMEAEYERLQEQYDRVAALGTDAARKQAALLKPALDRLQRRIERATKETAETADIQGYRLAQQQGFKGTFVEYKQSLRPEPSKVEVKLPEQEKAFETELGKGQAKKLIDDKAVADDARSIIDTVQQGRQLLQSGMITGFGAEALTQIGAALNQAGISFASDSVANTQAFAANMAQNVGRIIKQFGAGTGLSNADREYAEKMAGGKITLDRKAIERILDINERAARNVITAHNKRVAGVKTNVPLTVELPPAMPTAPAAAPAGRPSLQQIFQQPAGR